MYKDIQKIIDDFCNSAEKYKKSVINKANKSAEKLIQDYDDDIIRDDFECDAGHLLGPRTAYLASLDAVFEKIEKLPFEKRDLAKIELDKHKQTVLKKMTKSHNDAIAIINNAIGKAAKKYCIKRINPKHFSSLSEIAKNNIFDIIWAAAEMNSHSNSVLPTIDLFDSFIKEIDKVVNEVIKDIKKD